MAELSLGQALGLFVQGAKDFGFSEAVSESNKRVQSIRNSQEAEQVKQQQIRQEALQFSQEASARGGSPGQIQAVQQGFKLVAPPISKDGAAMKDLQGNIIKQLNTFDNRKDVKDLRGVLGVTDRIRARLTPSTPGGRVDRSRLNGSIKEIIKMAESRISDVDFQLQKPALNAIDRAKAILVDLVSGEATPELINEVLEQAQLIEDGAAGAFIRKVKSFAGPREQVLGIPSGSLSGLLTESLGISNVQKGATGLPPRQTRGADTPTLQTISNIPGFTISD